MEEELNKNTLNRKDNPFKVPDGYFETFEERLQERIAFEETGHNKSKDFIKVLKPVLWLAASFLLVMLLVQYPIKTFFPDYHAQNDSIKMDDESVLSLASLDDDDFYDLLSEDVKSELIEQEMLDDFITMELNDLDIYTGLN